MGDKSVEYIRGMQPAPPPAPLTVDQCDIWKMLEEAKLELLKKNTDYGSSVFNRPMLAPSVDGFTSILVRMSDKCKRLVELQERAGLVNDEALEDTLKDLGNYALLAVISLRRRKKDGVRATDARAG